ncbi:hypothetical protein PIB30_030655 [Stylosanthes scabra]|uniref:Uncharacterized protein n=1 Tax=Stylosanthes scabra TaxID=79078 RepID=A0ABU6ZBR5_9FABA|nr:hypothetical protein [Stylosanthes scabra]
MKPSKLRSYIKSLMRLLRKPKDLYVQAITTCSSHFPYVIDTTMGFPTPTLPRTSFTLESSTNNIKLPPLSASARTTSTHGNNNTSFGHPPRIGRIDEDKPCEFGYDDDYINVNHLICPPSRRYAFAVQARPRKRLF